MPKHKKRTLRLPVVVAVKVQNYPLYPGRDGTQLLEHAFPSGVSVIVGVNGQGKTTFLNMLYRAIIGRWEQTKADFANPGRGQHEVRQAAVNNYFSSRIRGDATAATAEITLRFGDDTVRLTRSLGKKLEIKELWHNETSLEHPDETRWEELALELSGVGSWYDFHFVVRHFLFFLEDKIPLLWNPYGQFEILRILFLDAELSNKCVELHDLILRNDSDYRNTRWHQTRIKETQAQMEQDLANDDANGDSMGNLGVVRSRVEAIRLHLEEVEKDIAATLERINTGETSLFEAEVALSRARSELEMTEREFFQRAFPDVEHITGLVFGYLMGDEPCPVCGSRHHPAATRLRNLIATGNCPACESKLPADTKVIRPSALLSRQLKSQEGLVGDREAVLSECREKLNGEREHLGTMVEERAGESRELRRLEARLQVMENIGQIPEELQKLRTEITTTERRLKEMYEELKRDRTKYEGLLEKANDQIQAAANEILKRFRHYVENFLSEPAHLSYEMHSRTIGEGGQSLEFPNFVLRLASAGQPEPTERPQSNQVSESQREFIDLAFRMALFDVAVKKHGPAMIAIETPEASLDAVYVQRAGAMLRAFGEAHSDNRVIATCNVNREAMVGHLLNTFGKSPRKVSKAFLNEHLINLLVVGSKTPAFEKSKAVYEKAFEEALYGG